MITALRIHLYPDHIETVKEAVDRAERTEEPAKAPIAQDACQGDHQHDDELAGEQDAQRAEHFRVGGIYQKSDRALEGPCRTDIFAEGRQRHIVIQAVIQRYGDHKEQQQNIFQPGQRPRDPALFDLKCRDPVQQFLKQAKRAKPSADGPSQYDPVEQNDPQHIPACPMVRGGQCILQGA